MADDAPVRLPIDGVLDLHSFAPREIAALVADYVAECRRLGILRVRLIHGRGRGVQRANVRRVLAGLREVVWFEDAPPEAGGWGATLVGLRAPDHAPRA